MKITVIKPCRIGKKLSEEEAREEVKFHAPPHYDNQLLAWENHIQSIQQRKLKETNT